MSPRLRSMISGLRRVSTATLLAVALAAAAVGASGAFGDFSEVYEGEIWELRHNLHMPLSLDENGVPIEWGNFTNDVTWVNGELFALDNYAGWITKFDANLNQVDLPNAAWRGAEGTPSSGWWPNVAISADVTVDGTLEKALVVSDFNNQPRMLVFRPTGEHLFTLVLPMGPDTGWRGINGVALAKGSSFALTTGQTPTLTLTGSLVAAVPDYYGGDMSGALVFQNTDAFTFTLADGGWRQFEAPAPVRVLNGEDATNPGTPTRITSFTGVTFDSNGNLYLLGEASAELYAFDPSLNPLFTTPIPFGQPWGLKMWPSAAGDRLLITVPYSNRAVAYAPFPRQTASQTLPPTGADYLFKLDGFGAIDGYPHSGEFDPASGRVAVADSLSNTVKVFQTPELAVFDVQVLDAAGAPLSPLQVCLLDTYKVRFSITVPEWKSPVRLVTPSLTIDGVDALSIPGSSITAEGDYPTADVLSVAAGDVLTYTYTLKAPDAAAHVPIQATAIGYATSRDPITGEFLPLTDVGAKLAEVPAVDCGTGTPPVIALDSLTYTVGGAELVPNAAGWVKVDPAYASGADSVPVGVTVNVKAAATGTATLDNVTYSLAGTNSVPLQTRDISSLALPTYTLSIPLEKSGVTVVTFQTQDSDGRQSYAALPPAQPPGSTTAVIRLDNSLPGACFTFTGGIQKTPAEYLVERADGRRVEAV